MDCCRFAPTTSGPAHPGTLLAGLLCWLDARSREARIELRLEDIDPTRCTPESARDLRAALDWFGLDWDGESLQSSRHREHERAIERLAQCGSLYPCHCSRSAVKRSGVRAADGGHRYPGTCARRCSGSGSTGTANPSRARGAGSTSGRSSSWRNAAPSTPAAVAAAR
jgi:glutamyl-Q tRNA(Asp) synthetase